MMYKLEPSEYGDHERDGIRYQTNECNAAYTPEGLNIGYTYFVSREEMQTAWNLTPITQTPQPDLPQNEPATTH